MLGSERDWFNMCCSYIQIHGKLVWGARICNGHVGTVYIWRKIWKINLSYFFPQGNSEHRYWDEQSVTLSSSYWWMWEHFQLTVDFFTERCLSLITPVFLTAFSLLFLEDKKKKIRSRVLGNIDRICYLRFLILPPIVLPSGWTLRKISFAIQPLTEEKS